ncbi:hypothetical protein [Saccharopolyspora endophytica]|uniref:Uncharacterized protein n=1 Tax=Saccharopolyspora endophytica TaxID=543886 RepID=A0ABS5D838_9PSEU|nr:hypothetical protein [Saccharopolyspora endophytica]MBQ0922453.1 hypothetical protein [Saccharopolyspora endophytica]
MSGRMLTVVLAAVAVAIPAAATAASAAPPAPVQVQLGEAKCQDMSAVVASMPVLAPAFPDGARTPVVEYRITGAPDAPMTPYEVKVNGETKGSGSVGAKGLIISSTSLPNNTTTKFEVTSGEKVLASRTYTPAC